MRSARFLPKVPHRFVMRVSFLPAALLISSARGQYVHCQIRAFYNNGCDSQHHTFPPEDSIFGWGTANSGNVYANQGTGMGLPFYLMSPSPTTECIAWATGDYWRAWVDVSTSRPRLKGACHPEFQPTPVPRVGLGLHARIPFSQAQSIPLQIAPTPGHRLTIPPTASVLHPKARETSTPEFKG
jgi:hypothetical protein